MTQNQKEHLRLGIAALFIVHILFCYSYGTLYPMTLDKEARDTEIIFIIVTQVFAHYFWINRDRIKKEMKDE